MRPRVRSSDPLRSRRHAFRFRFTAARQTRVAPPRPRAQQRSTAPQPLVCRRDAKK
ncbi:hypothetical protein BVI1335_160001 [Burkholderia vietnamiensis]|nr:hypothetical protein BVI1335_160001 [Burkholderia vietnamiensis]